VLLGCHHGCENVQEPAGRLKQISLQSTKNHKQYGKSRHFIIQGYLGVLKSKRQLCFATSTSIIPSQRLNEFKN
jgi:hypothetical protein